MPILYCVTNHAYSSPVGCTMHGVVRNALEAVDGDGPTDDAQHQADDLSYPDDDIRSILLRYGKYLQ